MIETFYLHLEFADKTGWSINLPFVCARCGKCCTVENFLTAGPLKGTTNENNEVHLSAARLYEEMGNLWEKDEDEYDRHIRKTPCPFLKADGCSVYPNRPRGCRQFPNTFFGKLSDECEALTRFKKQLAALRSKRKCSVTVHDAKIKRGKEPSVKKIVPAKCDPEQLITCLDKMHKAGATSEECFVFSFFNSRTDSAQTRR